MGPLADVDSEHGPGAQRRFHDGILLIVDRSELVRATPVLPSRGLVCARQFPISRPERRPPPVATPPRALYGAGEGRPSGGGRSAAPRGFSHSKAADRLRHPGGMLRETVMGDSGYTARIKTLVY